MYQETFDKVCNLSLLMEQIQAVVGNDAATVAVTGNEKSTTVYCVEGYETTIRELVAAHDASALSSGELAEKARTDTLKAAKGLNVAAEIAYLQGTLAVWFAKGDEAGRDGLLQHLARNQIQLLQTMQVQLNTAPLDVTDKPFNRDTQKGLARA